LGEEGKGEEGERDQGSGWETHWHMISVGLGFGERNALPEVE
jgi:hypothetical protein